MLSRIFAVLLTLLALMLAQPVWAANWLRAESDHYVVHAKLPESELRDLVVLMEDFDRVLRDMMPPQTRRGRKVQFYLQDRPTRIFRITGVRNEGLDVDLAEIPASFATFDRSRPSIHWYRSIFSDQANFYFRNAFWRPSPPWVEDGLGGLFATTYVTEDGAFVLGAPEILSPLQGLVSSSDLVAMMTTGRVPEGVWTNARFRGLNREAVTSLMLDPEYAGQLDQYLAAYSKGTTMSEATEVFGELDELASRIDERRVGRKPVFRQITPSLKTVSEITIRPMRDDEIALVVPRFERLYARNIEKTAGKLERLTQRHPESGIAWYEYAAAEFARVRGSELGGRPFRGFGFSSYEIIVSANQYSDANAWRAVNRALELQPDLPQAITLKAEILLSRLTRSEDFGDAAGYESVREMLAPLVLHPERNPLAAAISFQSFIEQGIEPTQEAFDSLGRAFIANPGVEEFRYAYAVALSRRGYKDESRLLLTAMLNNPDYRVAAERALAP